MREPHESVVTTQEQLAAAVNAAAGDGPVVIRFESPQGTRIVYRFGCNGTAPISEARAARIASRIKRSAKGLWT